MSVNGTTGVEVIARHDTHYEVSFTGPTVVAGDHVLFVRQDLALNNPGSECAEALSQLTTSAPAPYHGGEVVDDGNGNLIAEVNLHGVVDAVNPIETTATSDTGTFYLCFADKSTQGFTGDRCVKVTFVANGIVVEFSTIHWKIPAPVIPHPLVYEVATLRHTC